MKGSTYELIVKRRNAPISQQWMELASRSAIDPCVPTGHVDHDAEYESSKRFKTRL